jgi:hypothetical protein
MYCQLAALLQVLTITCVLLPDMHRMRQAPAPTVGPSC